MEKTIRNYLIVVVNTQTVVVILLSLIATFLCLQFNIVAELPTGLIGTAIVFPIVFSINAAYRRREEALRYFADLNAHAIALFYGHRDWVSDYDPEHPERIKEIIFRLSEAIQQSLSSEEENPEKFQQVYRIFSEISASLEKLREAGVSGSEISRLNQYMRSMIIDYERMKNISSYRTPTTLRAYSQVFLNTFPVLFAPYFADLAQEFFPAVGFFVAVFYSLVLVSLDNIQELLENPYDTIGHDDVNLNVADYYEQILISHVK